MKTKHKLISALTALAMLGCMTAVPAQAKSPLRLAPYRTTLEAFKTRLTNGFAKYMDADNPTYGVFVPTQGELLKNYSPFSYLWYRYTDVYTFENTGYCLLDLNNDGTEELLIGIQNADNNWMLVDLYTIAPPFCHLASAGERTRFDLLPDGTIRETGSNGASESVVYFYTVGSDRLNPVTAYKSNLNGYFMSTEIELKFSTYDNAPYYEPTNWQSITAEEYQTQTTGQTANLPMLPFSQYNDEVFISTRMTFGDFNDSGNINAEDARDVLMYAALIGGNPEDTISDDEFYAGDVNSDGLVNAGDACDILIYAAYAGAGGDLPLYQFINAQ